MRRSSGRQRVCSIMATFVQRGRNSAIDVCHRRVSFDPSELQLPRAIVSHRRVELFPEVQFSTKPFWASPRIRLLAVRTTYSLSDLAILKDTNNVEAIPAQIR